MLSLPAYFQYSPCLVRGRVRAKELPFERALMMIILLCNEDVSRIKAHRKIKLVLNSWRTDHAIGYHEFIDSYPGHVRILDPTQSH